MLRSTLAIVAIPAFLGACHAPTSAPTPAPAPAVPTPTGPGRVELHTFHSDALGVDKRYVIHLPGGYGADPAARWPVVYYLHGLGGRETD